MRELELMGTVGCHLCEVAEQLIASSVDMQAYAIYQVDIADDDDLVERYGVKIPVLLDLESKEELEWPFDQSKLLEFLQRVSN
ncbi:glutaredoxin family protein [Neptuniibacter sp. QD72_48]|uniref:glutaredoxin family protein n=1 Tax=unclassified Neptuniibacter TaxID=2630693 RepID=UPI0039F6E05D